VGKRGRSRRISGGYWQLSTHTRRYVPAGVSGAMSDVTLMPNGPLKVADARLMGADGSVVKEGDLFLCRCGHSANKPFCDGSHAKMGFEAE
jgi:hypothetical protein